MKYLKLVGPYESYGRPEMWDKDSNIQCVVDSYILGNKETNPNKQVMLLIEPRSIQPNVYEQVPDLANRYKYVFTHDSKLLSTLPNAKPIIWGTTWCRCEKPNKTKLMSMVSSNKEMCELHIERKVIARKYKNKIDVFGTIDGGQFTDPIDVVKDYKYSVIIENYIDELWFTEKVLNCFATKTIPIYYGATKINEYFDEDGMIICHSVGEVEMYIDYILSHQDIAEKMYKDKQKSIDINYELSKQYVNFEEWFYKTYKDEIEGMFE